MSQEIEPKQIAQNILFLDHLVELMALKNDAALSRKLDVAPPVISKIRHGRLPIGSSFLVRCHEICGITFKEMRKYVPPVPGL